ncbi:DUF58 domain-containing protein [Rummeliibacillus sp. NPDC094406]|uniref:DUF58 domain-containing protein n=1 Tax=Rummeliibacillus sp. NPDC094406 TaxID=3364511 RepID=UPI00380C706E
MNIKKNVLPVEWGSKIGRYSLQSRSRIRGQHKGSHRSHRFGSSLDFSDFREYHPGDDVRQLDWNIYARTEKYFIKRFLDEQEMRVHILLDTTKSMVQDDKWELAKLLTAALGSMVLNKDDHLSFSYVTDTPVPPFRRKGASFQYAFEQTVAKLENHIVNKSFANNAMNIVPKDSTILIIISDGLEPIEEWQAFLKQTPKVAGDVRFLQLQTAQEIAPNFTGDVQLVDVETKEPLNVSMSQNVTTSYKQLREAHQQQLEALCHQYGIAFLPVKTYDGIQHILFQQLTKAYWIQ